MPLERFTDVGKSFKPTVSITRQGLISFNKGAYHRFPISEYNYVVLFFDKENCPYLIHTNVTDGLALKPIV